MLGLSVPFMESLINENQLLIDQESKEKIKFYSSYTQSMSEMIMIVMAPIKLGKNLLQPTLTTKQIPEWLTNLMNLYHLSMLVMSCTPKIVL